LIQPIEHGILAAGLSK
jgi:hypothetical protein